MLKTKIIILDFDYTLFDAKKFKNYLAKSLQIFGVNKKLWQETYDQIRYRSNKEADYSPKKHLKILAAKTNNQLSDLKTAYDKIINNCAKFLYADSLDFLQKLQAKNLRLILLTFGNPSFQRQKIRASGINKYFKKIFCTNKDKFKVSNQIPNADNALFINDNPDEITKLQKIHPKADFIQIKRPNAKKFAVKLKDLKIYTDLKIKM